MEESQPARLRKQGQAYRQGYHHGLARARELLLRLLNEGIPPVVAMDLCRVFEEQVILPRRLHAATTSSAPPLFDAEQCQRLLREEKQRQSEGSS